VKKPKGRRKHKGGKLENLFSRGGRVFREKTKMLKQ